MVNIAVEDRFEKLDEEEKEIIDIFKYNRLDGKNIKITCDDNHYIKIPDFGKTYYTFSTDDNYMDNELVIISSELKEVYIPLNEDEIDFKERSTKFRPYIIDGINDGEEGKTTDFITEASFIQSKNRYILGTGPINPHETNEYITTESLDKLVKQYKQLISTLCV